MALRPSEDDLKGSEHFVDDEGTITAADKDGITHHYYTKETGDAFFAALESMIEEADALAVKLGYPDREAMFKKLGHDEVYRLLEEREGSD